MLDISLLRRDLDAVVERLNARKQPQAFLDVTLFQALEACVKEMHKYSNPCIVALPLTTGSAPYLEWIMNETKP